MKPKVEKKGVALLSYRLEAFLSGRESGILSRHTMFMESVMIADVLLALGYEVDVIDFENKTFVPKKKYDILISARKYFQRYAELINKDCIKIAHLDTSHWMFNNSAALARCCDVLRKRQVSLRSYRLVEENQAIECADYGVLLGNEFSSGTYAYCGKRMYSMPVPVARLYPKPNKDFSAVRKTFLWLGSRGFIHKGLDLVLEAFAEMPDYRLIVCGPIGKDPDFQQAFFRDLYERENVTTLGWIDVASEKFLTLANSAIGLIYPSCAEGQSGGIVTCMHAGLIPVLSKQGGVDIRPEYGLPLMELSVNEIRARVKELSDFPPARLAEMSLNAWVYAQRNHTRESYMARYTKIIEEIRGLRGASELSGARVDSPRVVS